MTNTSNPMPAFGDFVNVGIQFMKTERASKIQVTNTVFNKAMENKLPLTDKVKWLSYKTYVGGFKDYCHEYLISLTKTILSSIELIYNTKNPLKTKYKEEDIKNKFKDINKTITVELFKKLDPNNLTILTIVCDEIAFLDYAKNSNLNINFYRTVFLKDLRHVHDKAYPNEPDPLLTYIINQCQAMFDYITNGNDLTTAIEDKPNNDLRQSLQNKIDNLTPEQFEKFSINLLAHVLQVERPNTEISINHTGKTADGGIDGEIIIKDVLDEEKRIIQCKRYANNVTVSPVREFMGILKKYKYGYFITNSVFTKSCYKHELEEDDLKLINGKMIIDYMINYQYGIKEIEVKPTFEIDESCFN